MLQKNGEVKNRIDAQERNGRKALGGRDSWIAKCIPRGTCASTTASSPPLSAAGTSRAAGAPRGADFSAGPAAAGRSGTWAGGKARRCGRRTLMGKLDRARPRLYRSQILQVSMRLKALAEIYKMHSFALL